MDSSAQQQSTGRIARWDHLKCLLIFLVVFGHFVDEHTEDVVEARKAFMVIYSFHMPLFLFISGIFSKKNVDGKRYDKIGFYLVLYFVIKMLLCVSGWWYEEEAFRFSLLSEQYIPWYAFALFAFSLFTILVRRCRPAYILTLSVLLACFAGYDSAVGSNLVLSKLLVFYPFFYLGYCLDGEKVLRALSGRWCRILSAVFLALLVAVVWQKIDLVYELRPVFIGRRCYAKAFERESFQEWGAILRLAYYPVAAAIGAAVIALVPDGRPGNIIAQMGSRSLQVYALHGVFIKLLYGKFQAEVWMFSVWPRTPLLFVAILSGGVMLLCSLKIWERPFAVLKDIRKDGG